MTSGKSRAEGFGMRAPPWVLRNIFKKYQDIAKTTSCHFFFFFFFKEMYLLPQGYFREFYAVWYLPCSLFQFTESKWYFLIGTRRAHPTYKSDGWTSFPWEEGFGNHFTVLPSNSCTRQTESYLAKTDFLLMLIAHSYRGRFFFHRKRTKNNTTLIIWSKNTSPLPLNIKKWGFLTSKLI